MREPDNPKYKRFKTTNTHVKRDLVDPKGALEYAIEVRVSHVLRTNSVTDACALFLTDGVSSAGDPETILIISHALTANAFT